jgi:exodeoxyribonuclease VII large subunit
MRARLELERARLAGVLRADAFAGFPRRVREKRDFVGQSRGALTACLERRPAEYAARLRSAIRFLRDFPRVSELSRRRDAVARLASLLGERMERRGERRRSRLTELTGRLDALSPLAVLARGYAVAYREGSDAAIREAASLSIGDRIRVRFHRGEIAAVVRGGGRPADPGPLFRGEGDAS